VSARVSVDHSGGNWNRAGTGTHPYRDDKNNAVFVMADLSVGMK
jgi:hypothetical protein